LLRNEADQNELMTCTLGLGY